VKTKTQAGDWINPNGPQIQHLHERSFIESLIAMDFHALTLTGGGLLENVIAGGLFANGFNDLGVPPLLAAESCLRRRGWARPAAGGGAFVRVLAAAEYGKGFISAAETTLNTAVVAPMPSAKEMIAVDVNAGRDGCIVARDLSQSPLLRGTITRRSPPGASTGGSQQ
jgi:hypothetical protein